MTDITPGETGAELPIYEEVRLSSLVKPIYITEARNGLLCDMRSFAAALGIDRLTAEMGLALVNRAFGAVEGLDRNGVPVMLLPVENVGDWLLWPHRASRVRGATTQWRDVWAYEFPRAVDAVRETLSKANLSRLMRERQRLGAQRRKAGAPTKHSAASRSAQAGKLKQRQLLAAPANDRPTDLPAWLEWRDGATVVTAQVLRVLWATRDRQGPRFQTLHLTAKQASRIVSGVFPHPEPELLAAWRDTFGAFTDSAQSGQTACRPDSQSGMPL